MADLHGVFSLRFRQPHLRELVRELAEHENLSQNQVIERAIEADMVLRGARLAADLRQTAAAFDRLTAAARQQLIDDSLVRFADIEAGADPLHAEQYLPNEAERSVGGQAPMDRPRSAQA